MILDGTENDLKNIFVGREEYSSLPLFQTGYNFKDFRKDKLYGLKNKDNSFIIPREDKIIFNEEHGISSFDFVVNQYIKLYSKYNDLLIAGQLAKNSEINKLMTTPYKSYESIESSFQLNSSKNQDSFFAQELKNRSVSESIFDAIDLITEYTERFSFFSQSRIHTRIKFVNSNRTSLSNSALSIVLSKNSFTNDQLKVKFTQDRNFPILRKLAEQYGFYIDINAPWILVCNLSHPEVLNEIKSIAVQEFVLSGFSQADSENKVSMVQNVTEKALEKYFQTLPTYDYEKQKRFFYDLFLSFYQQRPINSQVVQCKQGTQIISTPRTLLIESDFFSSKNETHFLKSYVKLMNEENLYRYNLIEVDNIFQETLRKFLLDKEEAMMYLCSRFDQ